MPSRPLVELHVDAPPKAVLAAFDAALEHAPCPCDGGVSGRHVNLMICDNERHTFSPWISLELQEDERGTRLRGWFGPHPHLWTGFVALWAAQVFVAIGGTVYGFGQTVIGEAPWGFAVTGLCAVGLAASCTVNLLGQRFGARQMAITRAFVDQITAQLSAPTAEAEAEVVSA